MPLFLYPWGKSSWYPLDRRLGGPQNWSGHSGKEKNSGWTGVSHYRLNECFMAG